MLHFYPPIHTFKGSIFGLGPKSRPPGSQTLKDLKLGSILKKKKKAFWKELVYSLRT